MGYTRATRGNGKTTETWADAFRNVFGFLFRRRSKLSDVSIPETTPIKETTKKPYTMVGGEVAVSFRVGCRYFDSVKNRVYECIAVKGKRVRSVAFSCLDRVEELKSELLGIDKELYSWLWHRVRIVSGAETCERGALRADRQATASEVSEEFAFISRMFERDDSADHFAGGGCRSRLPTEAPTLRWKRL